MARRKKKWMARARRRMEQKGTVGAFTRWCKQQGYGGVTDECNRAGLRRGGVIAKRAAFAKAARTVARRRRKARRRK